MNEKITTDRIIELMMAQTGKDRTTVQTFVGELTALVNDSLIKDGSTRIKGIGKFRIVPVRERESITPEGDRIVVPAHHWLSYLPDKSLKDRINKPFAIFEAIEAGEGEAPVELPEDPEREYVDDEERPTDEVPLSAPSFISTPENESDDDEPTPTEPAPSAIPPTAEVEVLEEADETNNDVEPVSLIGSIWNDENPKSMNSEIKKEIAKDWSEGRTIDSRPVTVGEMAAARLKASQIITPEVATEKPEMKEPEPVRKSEPKAPADRTDPPTPAPGRANEQKTSRKKAVTVIPPLAPPPPVQPTPQPKKNEKRSSSNIPLYVVLGILLLLLLGGLFYHYFYYLPSSDTRAMGRAAGDKVVTSDTFVMPGEDPAGKDAAPEAGRNDKAQAANENDETLDPAAAADKARRAAAEKEAKEKAKAEEEAKAKEQKEEKKDKPAAPKRKVLATVRLEPGQFLTKLAEKYYGNKVFWVYIYEFNKSKIADPNHIPTNMEIKIPAKELYGIDADNSASVEKAKAIQSRLNARK